jgi:hypothetical protein
MSNFLDVSFHLFEHDYNFGAKEKSPEQMLKLTNYPQAEISERKWIKF